MSAKAKVISISDRDSKSPRTAFWADRELNEVGLVRAHDGALLDNRDGFYDEHSDNFIRTYDCRVCTAISRSLLDKLITVWVRDEPLDVEGGV